MPETSAEPTLVLHVDLTRVVSFAMQQNAVPLLRGLTIRNCGERPFDRVEVRIRCDPPVIAEKTLRLERLDPQKSHSLKDLALTLLREPLRRQTEREEGHLWFEVSSAGRVIRREPHPLSVLAYNEWAGAATMPEILAAHVLPNDPAIDRILADASRILREGGKDGALTAYQSGDPRRAYLEVLAIYMAASRLGIGYTSPPASFETTGQKIRTPEHLLDCRLGTCLDATVLLAACFEQAGLRPVAIVEEGHAFVGVWLIDKSFDEPVTRHASVLVNRIDLWEFVAVESTGLTNTPPMRFKDATASAAGHLRDGNRLRYAVDITSARKAGIRPLCLTGSEARRGDRDGADFGEPDGPEDELVVPPWVASTTRRPGRVSRTGASPAERLNRWKTGLLDLSLRNRLLNFKETKKAIPLSCPDIARLEDDLADGMEFRVLPRPEAWSEDDPRDRDLHRQQVGGDGLEDFLKAEQAQRRLHAKLTEAEVKARLTEMERAARLGMEECGANTLFLALGFLAWTESDSSEHELRAPILLVPMGLERKSIGDGFRIRRLDEESRINVTLLQKLRVDFKLELEGLDPLPEDEHGLDVPFILRAFREAIKRTPGWTVREEACLSILTFSRFLMWQDLEANVGDLLQNPIVRHLVETPNEPFEPGTSFPDTSTLDDTYPPSETFCPIPADSSQLRAVLAAAAGRTFVLQGPPGTGKSQTIVNLIAHGLALGKRVLFVAQKAAALDVVHKRLEEVGLEPFLLSLHSDKTTKEAFRAQLRKALEVAGTGPSVRWESETARLAALRRELNTYVSELHQPRAFGKTAFWTLSRLIGHAGKRKVALDLGTPDGRNDEEYERMTEAVQGVVGAARVSGCPAGHPLRAVRLASWNFGLEDDVSRAVREAGEALEDLRRQVVPLQSIPGVQGDASFAVLDWIREVTALLEQTPGVTAALLNEPDWPRVSEVLAGWVERGRICREGRESLLATYSQAIFTIELPGLLERLRARKTASFLRAWRMKASIRKTIRAVRLDGKKPKDLAALEADLRTAADVVQDLAAMQAQAGPLARLFGPVWQGADSDWEELGGVLDWADEARSILDRVPGVGLTSRHETRAAWVRLATEGRAQVAAGTPFASGAAAFRRAMLSFGQARMRLEQLLQLDEVAAWGSAESPGFLERTRQMLDSLAAHMPRLRDWTHYQAARATASRARLGPLVDAFERGEITGPELVEIFEHSFADWWGRRILRSIPSLAAFHGTGHDEKIEAFRALEDRVASLCRQEVFARLASRLPRPNEEDRGLASETGLLRRYAQGGRKTIRRVFKDCPKALARFKPCMLLSPLSVATFLGKDFPKFDIVVFDEASQLPTHEAIGAIARGHHLVVVGDSKQLPPTTFFERQSAGEDGEDEDEGEELDSILEEAVAAGFRSLSLDWHYRSRHELLIAFSNHQFYGNNLLTFPSAMDKDDRLGVRWIPVPDGVYEHGGNRTNHKEAEAVVAEVVRRLRDPEESKSLGIVTFSMAQQKLVESLLEKERGQCSAINDYFKPGPDSVFVKNLETVQGDERDVILFSICYGPDQNKVTSMNFGPLNRKGGERRLNVAVTRARRLLLVFSTLRAEAINESRTKSDGARHLRVFLKYAEIGVAALTGQTRSSEGGIESPFEQSVFDELTRHGWDVATQVGCSGYRIDLAIRDPEAPGRYLLGIECDGAAYHSAASARDRDCIRQSVLERLGWRLHRIWSTDWLHRRPREIERLVEAIERARVAVQRADREAKERVCCVPVQPEPEPAPEAPRIARRVGRPRRAENEAASAVIAPQRDDRPRKASPAHGIPLDPGHPLAEAIASLLPNADFICQVCGDDRAIIVNWSGPGLQCLSDEGCGKREPVVLDVVSRAVERLGMRCACGAAQRVCSSRTGTFIGCSDYPKCRTAVSWKDYCQQLWDRQGRA